jgi:hypothetical protein
MLTRLLAAALITGGLFGVSTVERPATTVAVAVKHGTVVQTVSACRRGKCKPPKPPTWL